MVDLLVDGAGNGEQDGPDPISVSEFVELLNQTYDYVFPGVTIMGELANFRVSKNKWVYFDLKDDESSVKFFGTVYMLPGPLEEGMLMRVKGTPHMHNNYGFSVNVQTMQPAGEGSIRRAAELLTRKLQAEGLFDDARKRPLPYPPKRIGLITSRQSAAYADFIKILGARWGGLQIDLIDVQVQGEAAPEQIVTAIERFNQLPEPPDVLVLIRGGGSADDLAAFSTEMVCRAVAASRVPTLAAIGHEIDLSLAELAADKRASTPSNAAELLVPDKRTVLEDLEQATTRMHDAVQDYLYVERTRLEDFVGDATKAIERQLERQQEHVRRSGQLLQVLSPQAALRRGYAVVRNELGGIVRGATDAPVGAIVHIEVDSDEITAQVTAHGRKARET
ncbi:MAG TPA: exodeoxyribonuclease VII large subunit [Candidatus Saccharimonadales bacterium]|nr:exodeoxyribonuclease VII large subunit [Candidatus Saccharimonadales bacterium]